MTPASPITELNAFLADHDPVARPTIFAVGTVVDEWKVTAFLGSGGNAEVYRVVRIDGTTGRARSHTSSDCCAARAERSGDMSAPFVPGRARSPSAPQPQQNEILVDESVGALKILLRKDDASKKRFLQEESLLSKQMGRHFAKFYASGEINGRLYHVSELLEPVDLPENEREIADYLLAVCKAVDALHRAGLVHRDIKPSNIMRRANGELVLIDFGLVKDTVRSSEPERDVSIVSGKAIAVGTPRFAAPEQMSGGEVTAASDIHAIGRLADMAFHSNPPRSWLPIIRRATSSIPEQRYPSVEEFAAAIRHRHRPRHFRIAASILIGLAVVSFVLGRARSPSAPQPQQNETLVEESVAWQTLCKNITTNLTVQELAWERLVTNTFANSTFVSPERAYRQVQKATEATIVRLNGVTNTFTNPIRLKGGREYWVTGPGVLDGTFLAEGTNVTMRLRSCIVRNHAAEPLTEVGINYDLQDGAGLELPELDEPDDHGRRYIERSGSPTRLNFKKRDWEEPITWKDEKETGL